MQKLASGFFNKVYVNKIKTLVFKVPLLTSFFTGETKKKLVYALEVHQEYLTDALPKTEIKSRSLSPRGYFMIQEFIKGRTLYTEDLLKNPELQKQFDHLVEQGIAMEKDKKLFFDIYGRNGFIQNFMEFFKKEPNFLYSNFLLTPEDVIKFIDVGYLPMSNPLVRCATHIRDFTNFIYNKKHTTQVSK